MTFRFASFLAVVALGSSSLFVASAAQAAKADDKSADDSKPSDDKSADAKPAGDQADEGEAKGDAAPAKSDKDAKAAADAEAASSPIENPGETYRFVGLRYRGIIVPKFMMNLFGQGGATVYVNGIGPEFGIRKDGFEYDFSAWYAAYSMDPTPFKASSDPATAWEIVESRIKVFYLTADFLWSHDFAPEFAINYGLGAGVGIVWGDLFRTQAYGPPGSDPSTGAGFQKCTAPGIPDPNYCGTDNAHYSGYTEPSWANGGSKPIIFPWFALQTGLRYKPHRNFVARLDAGFGTSGFFLGLGADYGL
ncbi:MAG TPA: hypothetical protein VGI10_01080 [Polyangiaceae bacterium]|jgi:hypothetical protein